MPPELDEAYGPSNRGRRLPQVTGKSVGEPLDRRQQVLGVNREYLQTLPVADVTPEITKILGGNL